MQRCDFFQKFT